MSFGELLANTDPRNQFDGHVFIDADGAEHRFHRKLHQTDPEDAGDGDKYANQKVLYTRDGSYLRLRLGPIAVEGGTIQGWIVEHPDGMTHLFNSLFELIGIEDRFQNRLTISQQASVWTLTDPHGRTQRLHFVLKTFDQGSRRVLDRVEIQGPNNNTSTWSLEYQQELIPRACPDCPANSNNSTMTSHTLPVPFLTRIRQPDGSTWEMPSSTSYQTTSDGFTPDGVGVLKQLKLPSQARFEWDYGLYRYPEPSDRAPHRRNARGVIARRKIRSDNTVEGLWTYTPQLTSENAPGNVQPQSAELVVQERTPLGDLTEHFYSVYASISRRSRYLEPTSSISACRLRPKSSTRRTVSSLDASTTANRTARTALPCARSTCATNGNQAIRSTRIWASKSVDSRPIRASSKSARCFWTIGRRTARRAKSSQPTAASTASVTIVTLASTSRHDLWRGTHGVG
ncbi:MAG: hypothetical protein HC794_04075 [Nitrospiraceae bacterium]|nr:hypothetical protein [Nitrospiraceae bacterium]